MPIRDERELRHILGHDPDDQEATAALANLLEEEARHDELIELLLTMAEQDERLTGQAALLARVGRIFIAELGLPEQAAAALEQALELDPECVPALEQQANLHRLEARWTELFEVLQRLAVMAQDAPAKAELHVEMARLCEDRLYEKDRAIAWYREALELDSGNLAALKALERLHKEQQQWEPLADVLARRAELHDDAKQAVALMERAAEINEERLKRPDRAIELLEDVLALLPDHASAQRALQRLYRRAGRLLELADLLTLQLENTWSPDERIELQLERATLFEEDLNDPERALDAFKAVQDLAPDSIRPLDGQARMYGKMEQWDRALEVMQQLTVRLEEPDRLAETHFRMGEIHEDVHQDLQHAELLYQEALAHTPDHLGAMTRLIELTSARGDWGKTARMLERAAEAERDPAEQSSLLKRAGEVCLQRLEDEARGVDLLERSLALNAAQPIIAGLLRPIYLDAGNHTGLEPLLDLLLADGAGLPAAELLSLHLEQARTCEALGHESKALSHYRMVLERQPTHLEALIHLVELLCRLDEAAQAFAVILSILENHGEGMPAEQQAQLHHRLGMIQLRREEHGLARASFRTALDLDPTNRAALEAMDTASAGGEDWAEMVAARRELLVGAEPEERLRLLTECGEMCLEQLDDPEQAAADFVDALELDPDNRRLLHGLLEAHQKRGHWPETLEVLDRQIALEDQPARRSRYHHVGAVIKRDELGDSAGAIASFNRALDDDYSLHDAFESLDALCKALGDPEVRVKNLRRMLKRITGKDGEPELQITLWNDLGELLRGMDRLEDAAIALDVACRLDPKNRERLAQLAQLYSQLGQEHAPEAVRVYRAMINMDPNRASPYRGLRRAYTDSGQLDQAFCVSAMLSFTGKARPVEQELFDRHRDQRLRRARSVLEEKLWQRHLTHPYQDPYISAMLALVTPFVAAASARPAASFKLRREQLHDANLDPDPFCGLVSHMTRVLGVASVNLYMNPDHPCGLQLLHTSGAPSLLAGGGLLRGRSEMEQAYTVATCLALLRPESYLRGIMESPAELKTVIYIAFRLVQPTIPVPPGEMPAVERGLEMVAGMVHPAILKQLRQVVGKFSASGKDLNLNRWWRAAGLTASRVGFLLCNDLHTAVKMMMAEPPKDRDASPEEKVEDLVRYATSEDYFILRRHLGLSAIP